MGSSSDIPADARLQTVCLIRRGAEGKRKSLRDLRCFRCSLLITRVVLLCSGLKPRRWARNEASSLICQHMTEITKGLRPQISGLRLIKRLEKKTESSSEFEDEMLKVIFADLFILGKLVCPSFSEGQATGVAGTSLAQSQAEVASVA